MSKPASMGKPVSERLLISVQEASNMSGIGINRLYALTKKEDCPWRFKNGKVTMVKREIFIDCVVNGKGFE